MQENRDMGCIPICLLGMCGLLIGIVVMFVTEAGEPDYSGYIIDVHVGSIPVNDVSIVGLQMDDGDLGAGRTLLMYRFTLGNSPVIPRDNNHSTGSAIIIIDDSMTDEVAREMATQAVRDAVIALGWSNNELNIVWH